MQFCLVTKNVTNSPSHSFHHTMIPHKISGNATQRLPPDHPSLNCTASLKALPCWFDSPTPGFLRDDLLEHSKQRTILTQHCCVSFVCLHPSMLNECCFILYSSIWVIVVGRKYVANPWHHYSFLLFHCSFFFLRAQGNSIWPFTQPCFRNIGLEASFSWKMEKGANFLLREFEGPRGKK